MRATCLADNDPKHKHIFTSDLSITPQMLYKMCLDPYFESLGLYLARDGPDAETTLRMQCNLALVYDSLSRLEPEGYIESAEAYYLRAIEDSTRLSGYVLLEMHGHALLLCVRQTGVVCEADWCCV